MAQVTSHFAIGGWFILGLSHWPKKNWMIPDENQKPGDFCRSLSRLGYKRLKAGQVTGTSCIWLVVWTPLKNISQLGWLFPIYWKIKNVPNHQPVLQALVWGDKADKVVLTPSEERRVTSSTSHPQRYPATAPNAFSMLCSCSVEKSVSCETVMGLWDLSWKITSFTSFPGPSFATTVMHRSNCYIQRFLKYPKWCQTQIPKLWSQI